MKRTRPPVLVIAGLLGGVLTLAHEPGAARPAYPPTATHPVADTLHGKVIPDPYRWLEDGASPEVEAWTEAQNACTRGLLDRWPGRAALTARLESTIGVPTVLEARVFGQRVFVVRRDGLQNQAVVHVHEGGPRGPSKVAIDPNLFSADGTVALDWWYPSPDGALIAYGRSEGGSEMSTLHVRDVLTGRDLPLAIPQTQRASVAWDPDGRGFLYSRHPAPGEVPAGEEVFHQTIRHHRLGADPKADPVVYAGEPGAPIQEVRWVTASGDDRWTFLGTTTDWTKNDLYARRAGTDDPWLPLARGLDGQTDANAHRGTLYLRTNVGAPRYRIVATDGRAPGPGAWRTVVPEQAGVIEAFTIVDGRLVLHVLENASSRVRIFSLEGRLEKELALPTLGTVDKLDGDPAGKDLLFAFTSFAHPSMVQHYDFRTGRLAPLESRQLPFDPAAYDVRQEWTESKDGTRVPMFLVARRGVARDGARPTLLHGYGGFGVSQTPQYRFSILPWLDAGGVFVVANLRGGGEFGREWHEAGRLERKQNVYDDLYACADWLVAQGVTRQDRLACWGGSNGGLLVGAAITQRPELWGAAVCEVPLLDMLRYHRFSIARYWIPEYGSADDAAQFGFLHAYSPYHNVRPGVRYPATLFATAASDSRVEPLHARKMVARLQAVDAGEGPILLRLESKAGHGQGKPTRKRVDAAVDMLSFLFARMGIEALP